MLLCQITEGASDFVFARTTNIQMMYSVNQKNHPCGLQFSDIFWQMVENLKSFLHTY